MSDEQILDLDLAQFAAGAPEIAPEAAGEPDLWDMPAEPTSSSRPQNGAMTSSGDESAPNRGLSAHETLLSPESAVIRTAFPGSTNAAQGASPPAVRSNAPNAQGEPAWLKQLEAQPAAAAEARQWREAANDVAALDAAYFSGDAGARGGLAARLYESDPGAFREMLAESARMLASRDPQALAELARQLGMSEAQAQNAPAKSLVQAARAQEPAAVVQHPATGGLRGNAGTRRAPKRHFPPRLTVHLNPRPIKTWRGRRASPSTARSARRCRRASATARGGALATMFSANCTPRFPPTAS